MQQGCTLPRDSGNSRSIVKLQPVLMSAAALKRVLTKCEVLLCRRLREDCGIIDDRRRSAMKKSGSFVLLRTETPPFHVPIDPSPFRKRRTPCCEHADLLGIMLLHTTIGVTSKFVSRPTSNQAQRYVKEGTKKVTSAVLIVWLYMFYPRASKYTRWVWSLFRRTLHGLTIITKTHPHMKDYHKFSRTTRPYLCFMPWSTGFRQMAASNQR